MICWLKSILIHKKLAFVKCFKSTLDHSGLTPKSDCWLKQLTLISWCKNSWLTRPPKFSAIYSLNFGATTEGNFEFFFFYRQTLVDQNQLEASNFEKNISKIVWILKVVWARICNFWLFFCIDFSNALHWSLFLSTIWLWR